MKLTTFIVATLLLLLLLSAQVARGAGSDPEAVQWADNFYKKLIEPITLAADIKGLEDTFKANEYHLTMPDGLAFSAELAAGLEKLAAGAIKSTNRLAEYVRENRVDPAVGDAPESIGNEDGFFVDPCSLYTKESAEGLLDMVSVYNVEKFGDEPVNLNHSIVTLVRPSLAKTAYVKNELLNAHGLKEIFLY